MSRGHHKNHSRNLLASDLDHVLAHTRGLWDELRGKRVFITGGTGFFGCWLLESFAWANDKLRLGATATVLSRDPKAFAKKAPHLASHGAIQFLTGDVRDFKYPGGAWTYVIHAACETRAKGYEESPAEMLDTIVRGTQHTLDFAVHCGAKKFLLISSGAVYGRQPSDLTHVPEDYPGAPDPLDWRSVYGLGKRAAENLCACYARAHPLEIKIARCFAFVGPYLPLDIHFAIGNFIRDGLNGGPIRVLGDGTPHRSYLYAADLAIWLWKILFHGRSCYPVNVGSDVDKPVVSVAKMVQESLGGKIPVSIAKDPDLSRPVERYVPDTQRARSQLGLEVWVDLPDAIRRTASWNRSVPP